MLSLQRKKKFDAIQVEPPFLLFTQEDKRTLCPAGCRKHESDQNPERTQRCVTAIGAVPYDFHQNCNNWYCHQNERNKNNKSSKWMDNLEEDRNGLQLWLPPNRLSKFIFLCVSFK